MNQSDHEAMARRYMISSQRNEDQGMAIEAGEILWGALVHGIDCLAHKHGRRNRGSNRAREGLMEDMATLGVIDNDDVGIFKYSGIPLHARFYKASEEDEALIGDMDAARGLVDRLLSAA